MRALAVFVLSAILFLTGCATTPPVAQPISVSDELIASRPTSESLPTAPADPRLAADDIIEHHLSADEPRFDVVVFAEENPESPIHLATVLTGQAAARRLHALMNEETVDLSKGSTEIPAPGK